MAGDPFSIAGIFGLTAGLIGFLASTIEKSVSQIDTAKHAYQRMQGYQEALQTCRCRLEAWGRQWYGECDEIHVDEDFQFLWGVKGFVDIKDKMSTIDAELRGLLKLLYGGESARSSGGEYAHRWELIVQDSIRSAHPPTDIHSELRGFLERMSMSLWKNNLLSAATSRLCECIGGLETTSCIYFHQARGDTSRPYNAQPSKDDIDLCLQHRRRTIHLTKALCKAYEVLRSHGRFCELLLIPFDEIETCQLERQQELTLTFLTASHGLHYRRLVARCHLDSDQANFILNQAQTLLGNEHAAQEGAMMESDTIRSDFFQILELEKYMQSVYREDIKLHCMGTAVCIAAWSMLTWESKWLDNLSSCRVTQARFVNGEKMPVVCANLCSQDGCDSYHSSGRPYLRLAILLAELALACPIYVRLRDKRRVYVLHSSSDEKYAARDVISKSELLDRVTFATSWFFKNAVKYCLNQDISCDPGSGMAAYDQAQFYRKVVKPLNNHYQPLKHDVEIVPSFYEYLHREAAIRTKQQRPRSP